MQLVSASGRGEAPWLRTWGNSPAPHRDYAHSFAGEPAIHLSFIWHTLQKAYIFMSWGSWNSELHLVENRQRVHTRKRSVSKGYVHFRHSLLGKRISHSYSEIMNWTVRIKETKPYIPSEVSVLMDERDRFLFPGKKALQEQYFLTL